MEANRSLKLLEIQFFCDQGADCFTNAVIVMLR